MSVENLTLHFHKWGFSNEDFQTNYPNFLKLFKEIGYDVLPDGTPYPVAFEGRELPIFNVLFHPEYLMVMDKDKGPHP
jgi:hypothetical protein